MRSFSPHARRRAPAAAPAKRATFRGFGRRRVWPRPCLSMRRRISSLEVERSHIDGACRTDGQRRSRAALRRRRAVVGVPVSEAHQAGERRGGQPSRRRRLQRPAAGRRGRGAAQGRQARGVGSEGQGGHEGPRHVAAAAGAWYQGVVADDLEPALATARGWIDAARRIVVLTGAGISTDSGIPDFRGPQGVWTKNPEAEKMATLQHYVADPEVRRRAWRTRVESPMHDREPNDGHRALVTLERRGKLHTLVTQNVDALHHLAGSDPAKIVEIHGTMREVECLSCGERAPMERALERVRAGEEDPPCRTCGGILKSATISFGQNLVADDLVRAQLAAEACDLLLAVGSSLGVYPAAGMVPIAKESGSAVVIVNAEPTPFDPVADAVLQGSISELLPGSVRHAGP